MQAQSTGKSTQTVKVKTNSILCTSAWLQVTKCTTTQLLPMRWLSLRTCKSCTLANFVKILTSCCLSLLFFWLLQIRPYLMADGGNVELLEIDGLVVMLKLQGACGSCPSSLTTMTMGIKRRLMEKIPVSRIYQKWMVFASVTKDIEFCIKPLQQQTV